MYFRCTTKSRWIKSKFSIYHSRDCSLIVIRFSHKRHRQIKCSSHSQHIIVWWSTFTLLEDVVLTILLVISRTTTTQPRYTRINTRKKSRRTTPKIFKFVVFCPAIGYCDKRAGNTHPQSLPVSTQNIHRVQQQCIFILFAISGDARIQFGRNHIKFVSTIKTRNCMIYSIVVVLAGWQNHNTRMINTKINKYITHTHSTCMHAKNQPTERRYIECACSGSSTTQY